MHQKLLLHGAARIIFRGDGDEEEAVPVPVLPPYRIFGKITCIVIFGINVPVGVALSLGAFSFVWQPVGFVLKLLELLHIFFCGLCAVALVVEGVVENPAAAAVYDAEFRQLEFHVGIIRADDIGIISALPLYQNDMVFDGKVACGVLVGDMCGLFAGLYHFQPGRMILAEGAFGMVIHIKGGLMVGVGALRGIADQFHSVPDQGAERAVLLPGQRQDAV